MALPVTTQRNQSGPLGADLRRLSSVPYTSKINVWFSSEDLKMLHKAKDWDYHSYFTHDQNWNTRSTRTGLRAGKFCIIHWCFPTCLQPGHLATAFTLVLWLCHLNTPHHLTLSPLSCQHQPSPSSLVAASSLPHLAMTAALVGMLVTPCRAFKLVLPTAPWLGRQAGLAANLNHNSTLLALCPTWERSLFLQYKNTPQSIYYITQISEKHC